MRMTLRPMTPQERKYSYAQPHWEIAVKRGFIGYLREDFGRNGTSFYTTFFDYQENLKSDEFKAEFDTVINSLRDNSDFGGILKSRQDMAAYCQAHPESGFDGTYTKEYGVRVNTDDFTYMLRLNPLEGDYNLYCFCYVRKYLDSHMERAKSGIRFITPDYKEKFHIADEDKIRVSTADGKYEDRVCNYIDDYHFVFAQNIYHICEFAELMERQGSTVIPLRASLPEQCYATLQSTGELIIIKRGEKGYYRCEFSTEDKVFNQELADERNEMLGVTKAQVSAMQAGSMFGWEVAAADPQNYDNEGYLSHR